MLDLFGTAILDYQTNNNPQDLITSTNISDLDEMSIAYLYRNFDQMPIIEQQALLQARGKVLDVGCGAGSHSLYLQNVIGLEVTSIDVSKNAIKACENRGLSNAICSNLLDLKTYKYDTILLLMNGTGIFENLKKVPTYLHKLKTLLAIDGQILIDSSDLAYMYDPDDLSYFKNNPDLYYGELTFEISYKNQTEKPFDWLYLDYQKLHDICIKNNLHCQKILQGDHHDFLARITL